MLKYLQKSTLESGLYGLYQSDVFTCVEMGTTQNPLHLSLTKNDSRDQNLQDKFSVVSVKEFEC